MTDQEEWLTASQVAAMKRIGSKRVSAQSVTAACREGRLQGQRAGRIWIIRRADAEKWQPVGHRPKKPVPDSLRR